jgi:N-acetylneuraminic acid mutarotase
MPTARAGLGVAVGKDGRVYAVGGMYGSVLKTVEVYTPATNTWEKLPDLKIGRMSAGVSAGADGRIYVVGGSSTTSTPGALASVEVYSPATNTWTTAADLPTPTADLVTVTGVDGRIYAIGGWLGGAIATVVAYTPSTNTWAPVKNMLEPRVFPGATLGTDGQIYALGGSNSATAEVYTP